LRELNDHLVELARVVGGLAKVAEPDIPKDLRENIQQLVKFVLLTPSLFISASLTSLLF